MAQGVPKAVIEMLRRVPLLSACTQAELRQIANLGTHVSVPDGKVLIQQGKVGREFFMLLGGRALCYVDGALMATFEPGDFFGEMALLRRSPRQATVVADGGVDLLILDVIMPRLRGPEAYKRIRELSGDVPVLLCTGYNPDSTQVEITAGHPVLQKPYQTRDLARTVRLLLDQRSQPAS